MTTRYFDAQNREVFPQTINTICPVAYVDSARVLAHRYMTTVEQAIDMTADQMMLTLLAPLGEAVPTHIFCTREGFSHQVESEVEFLASQPEEWTAKRLYTLDDSPDEIRSRFCCLIGDPAELLARLGLREVA